MVTVTCDRCGKIIENNNKSFLYKIQYDFCNECQEIYDKLENDISAMAKQMKEECEINIQKKADEMMKNFKLGGEKDEKESI